MLQSFTFLDSMFCGLGNLSRLDTHALCDSQMRTEYMRNPAWRAALLISTAVAVVLLLSGCNREPLIDLDVQFWHLRAADAVLDIRQVDQNNHLGDTVAKYVDQLRLKAVARGGSGGIYFSSGTSAPEVHVLLLAQEPVISDAELAIPRSGDVVYLLRNQQWEAYPEDVMKRAEQRIRIIADPNKKGAFELKITRIRKEPNGFKYAPTLDEDVQQPPLEQAK